MQYIRNNILTVWIHINVMQVWILNWYALFRVNYTVHCQVNVAGMHEWSKLVPRILPFKSLSEVCNFSLSIMNEMLSIQVENNKNISTWGWKFKRVCCAHSMVKGAKMTTHKRNTHVILMYVIITASITSELSTYIVPNVKTRSNRNCYKAYQRY